VISSMHDGFGSTLVSSIALTERGEPTSSELADLLRECLDDVRAILDSRERRITISRRCWVHFDSNGVAGLKQPTLPWLTAVHDVDEHVQCRSEHHSVCSRLLDDDSPPVIGNFPNINDRAAVLRYVYSKKQFGLQYSPSTGWTLRSTKDTW
jgi:hypothetical protein